MRLGTIGVLAALFVGLLLPGAIARADEAAVPKGLEQSDWSSIRAAYEAHRHAVLADESTPGHYRARNPGQRWITTFDGRGFSKSPDAGLPGGGWTWGLDLVSYGRGDSQQMISGTAKVQPSGTRVEYVWNESLTEWYINDQRGFEHGYTLRERPEGASSADATNANGGGMLHFTLAVRGELRPRVSENGRDVAFVTRGDGGTTALTYNNLKVFDADGVHLAASFQATTTTAGTQALLLTIDDTGACYPITIDPTAQQAYLKASNNFPVCNDQFGASIAISANTVVVGAPLEDSSTTGINSTANENAIDSGAVYVFERNTTAGTWSQQAYIKASNTGAGDNFGISVAVSGTTIVVGASGEDSSATGVNGADNNIFGNSGAAYVFTRPAGGSTWTQVAYLKASNTDSNDNFGVAVAISGDMVVVGADGEDSSATGVNGAQTNANFFFDSGAAYVFTRPFGGTTWSQRAYLKASNTGGGDNFGRSVFVSLSNVIVGAPGEDSSATGIDGLQSSNSAIDSGAAYVFADVFNTPFQQAYLKASNTGAGDAFGAAVAFGTDTAVVGARGEDSNATGVNANATQQADNSAIDSGAAYIFTRPSGGTNWTQQAYVKASNTDGSDQFGIAVSVADNTVVIGARTEDGASTGVNGTSNESAIDAGAAYAFTRSGTTWTQQAYLKASNLSTVSSDQFGFSVGVSGDTVVIGAKLEDSDATGVNGANNNNNATDSGAAYIFVRSGTSWTQQAFLKASNAAAGDQFGSSVAISANTVVIGALLESSNARGVNGDQADNSASFSGAAYVFVRSGTVWTQQAYLKASNTSLSDNFGGAVDVTGDTVVVGASREDSIATGVNGNQNDENASDSGAVYVFLRSGTTWTQQAYIKASNTQTNDLFGWSVAVDGNTLVVGAFGEDSNAQGVGGNQADENAADAGAAYVFTRAGGAWTLQAYLKASNTGESDNFGNSVDISGDTVVVGASKEDSNARGTSADATQQANNTAGGAGAAYVFTRASGGTTWSQQAYLKASNTDASDAFGLSVAIAGDTIVVGAPGEDSASMNINVSENDNSAQGAGAAYVFVRRPSGMTWTQQAYLKASNTGAGDQFGSPVVVSGDTVVVGAHREDSNATGVGGSQTDNRATDAGAGYVFVLGLPTPSSLLASPAILCSNRPPAPSALSVADPGAGIVIDWFTGSCGGTLIGTGNPLNVTPAATTTYFARARRTADGNTSDACASVTVTVTNCRCNPADIAYDTGEPLPPIGPTGPSLVNNGVTEGDYNLFFATFFDAGLACDIADDTGQALPPFGNGGIPPFVNNGVTEGDYNLFFAIFFDGCAF